jgi:hypothetical protein
MFAHSFFSQCQLRAASKLPTTLSSFVDMLPKTPCKLRKPQHASFESEDLFGQVAELFEGPAFEEGTVFLFTQ